MPSADRSARRQAAAVVALTLGRGLPAAPAVPAQAADTPQPAAYTFDEDDFASGRITKISGNDLTASLVNGDTAQFVAGADGGRTLALPGGRPPPTARASGPAKCSATRPT